MRKEFKNKNGETVILEKIDGKWVKLEEAVKQQMRHIEDEIKKLSKDLLSGKGIEIIPTGREIEVKPKSVILPEAIFSRIKALIVTMNNMEIFK
jgi:hypothetical protein